MNSLNILMNDELNAVRYKIRDNIYIVLCFDENERPIELFAKFPEELPLNKIQAEWSRACLYITEGLEGGETLSEALDKMWNGKIKDKLKEIFK